MLSKSRERKDRKIDIDVNELLKPFGGGGHKAASGLRKKTDDVNSLCKEILKRVNDCVYMHEDDE